MPIYEGKLRFRLHSAKSVVNLTIHLAAVDRANARHNIHLKNVAQTTRSGDVSDPTQIETKRNLRHGGPAGDRPLWSIVRRDADSFRTF